MFAISAAFSIERFGLFRGVKRGGTRVREENRTERTILVAPDTPEAHDELDFRLSKTVELKNAAAGTLGTEVLNLLRTAFTFQQVQLNSASAIEIRDTPERVGLAEQIISSLDIAR